MLVLLDERHGCQIPQGLVGSFEVVLDEPFGQVAIEEVRVRGEIAQLYKLFFQRAVEAFVGGIVLGGMDARDVLPNTQFPTRVCKRSFELRSVVMAHVLDLGLAQVVQTPEEVCGIAGTL